MDAVARAAGIPITEVRRATMLSGESGEYQIVEGVHAIILHLMTQYFKDYFNRLIELPAARAKPV